MTDDTCTILQAMRAMAWERAKGELKALLCTYYYSKYDSHGNQIPDGYKEKSQAIRDFIKLIEEETRA